MSREPSKVNGLRILRQFASYQAGMLISLLGMFIISSPAFLLLGSIKRAEDAIYNSYFKSSYRSWDRILNNDFDITSIRHVSGVILLVMVLAFPLLPMLTAHLSGRLMLRDASQSGAVRTGFAIFLKSRFLALSLVLGVVASFMLMILLISMVNQYVITVSEFFLICTIYMALPVYHGFLWWAPFLSMKKLAAKGNNAMTLSSGRLAEVMLAIFTYLAGIVMYALPYKMPGLVRYGSIAIISGCLGFFLYHRALKRQAVAAIEKTDAQEPCQEQAGG